MEHNSLVGMNEEGNTIHNQKQNQQQRMRIHSGFCFCFSRESRNAAVIGAYAMKMNSENADG